MNINPISFILIVVFIYPILKGFFLKFSSKNLKADIKEVESNISFIISLFLGINISKKIFIEHDKGIYKKIYEIIPINVKMYIDNKMIIFYVVIIPLMIFIFYKLLGIILEILNYIIFYPVLDALEKFIQNKSNISKRITGGISQIPKAISYTLIITFILNFASMFNILSKYNVYLEESKIYSALCKEIVVPISNSKLAKKLPDILDNSFKIVVKETEDKNEYSKDTTIYPSNTSDKKVIIYYNGITLDEGIKSNENIRSFAKNLTKDAASDREKAKILYEWIGKNIDYDYDKANSVLNNDFSMKSGAIPAFETKKGICFDYACLYVAMARANGLKVRIITGDGFNGISWVSHAWNQVYIKEENKWINVDTTFYKGGNYFDSKRFNIDHRNERVAGEW
jgi:hypothetical protein